MKHELTINTLEDIECKPCTWRSRFYGGTRTKTDVKKEFEHHCYYDFISQWGKDHSISRAPSFTSWKDNYKNI